MQIGQTAVEVARRIRIGLRDLHQNRRWLFDDVVLPFALTRVALVLVGWFSKYFPFNSSLSLTHAVARGWWFSPYRLVDIWGRWDSGWYLDVVLNGYYLQGQLGVAESNVNFFPLFPYIIKGLALSVPVRARTEGAILALGVLFASVATLVGLALLYLLAREMLGDEDVARRAVLYTLLFPSAFTLTCFLSEPLFLCLTVAAFLAASRRVWWAAGILGGLVALTRPLGVLTVIPLAWMAAEEVRWDIRKPTPQVAWLALVPGAWIALMAWMYALTGHILAPYASQQAWGWVQGFVWPWEAILRPAGAVPYIAPVQQITTTLFLVLGAIAPFALPSRSYGIYVLLSLAPALLGRPSLPTLRYFLVLFPGFILLALLGRRQWVHWCVVPICFALQILCFFAWCQFYYVV